MHILKEEARDHEILQSMFSAWREARGDRGQLAQPSATCNPARKMSTVTVAFNVLRCFRGMTVTMPSTIGDVLPQPRCS
eukprot:3240311-Karenia_brevis.AAC.1